MGDLSVGGPVLQELEHLGLAWGQQVGPLDADALHATRRRRRPGQHVHAARGEMDGADDVARLGLLGQAGGCPEGQHLVAVGRGGAVGQHHDARLGMLLVELEDIRRRAQRPEVDQRDRGLVLGDALGQFVHRNVGRHEVQVGVLRDERLETNRHQVLELCGDHGRHPSAVYAEQGLERVILSHPPA